MGEVGKLMPLLVDIKTFIEESTVVQTVNAGFPSFLRRQESRTRLNFWIPAYAGMTLLPAEVMDKVGDLKLAVSQHCLRFVEFFFEVEIVSAVRRELVILRCKADLVWEGMREVGDNLGRIFSESNQIDITISKKFLVFKL